MSKIDYQEAQTRVEEFAGVLGLTPPESLVDEDNAPTGELLTFCRTTGMSLDWVFLGDIRPMVLATYWGRCNVQ